MCSCAQSNVDRVGSLFSTHARCVAGSNPFTAAASPITVNLEVFNVSDSVVSLLQIRALAAKGHEEALASDIALWAKAAGFSRVFVIGGADATMRTDTQLPPAYAPVDAASAHVLFACLVCHSALCMHGHTVCVSVRRLYHRCQFRTITNLGMETVADDADAKAVIAKTVTLGWPALEAPVRACSGRMGSRHICCLFTVCAPCASCTFVAAVGRAWIGRSRPFRAPLSPVCRRWCFGSHDDCTRRLRYVRCTVLVVPCGMR
jgi:hypothetical protein